MKLRVHDLAEAELLAAAEWYEERERGLGERFLSEYQGTLERILRVPRRFAKLETTRSRRKLRRCFIQRFPYYVGYEIVGSEINVLSVAHMKRRPNYWIRRR